MGHRSKLVAWAMFGASCALVMAGGSCGRGSSGDGPGAARGAHGSAQSFSPFIAVDQFGYRPAAEKIAVLRTPVIGFDKDKSYTPGAKVAIVDAHSGAKVLEAVPQPWNGGATDDSSGDKAWWLDFSSVTAVGDYFVLDEAANARSVVFHIGDDAYRDVLTQSTRMFYYQRDGIAKDAKYAGADWADDMAHPQDEKCRLFSDGSSPRDLHGGWFDAGDENRYTNWAANDVIELLHAYVENPTAFGDATNIPESGNAVPDLLDEVKWEIDWLVRMQNADGSLLSVAGHQGASPPSADKSPCKYGPVNTSGTLTTAAAFAFASKVYGSVPSVATAYPGFSIDLGTRAKVAWTWAVAHPGVTFYNTGAVASGEQEVDDNARLQKKVQAAVYLFRLTGDAKYQSFVDANYSSLLSSFDPYHMDQLDAALDYTNASGATASTTSAILAAFKRGVESPEYLGTLTSNPDPYLAPLHAYVWGSNLAKAGQGNMFADVATFSVDATASEGAMRAAERYVHYLHGVNPLQLVYLSNMPGAKKGVTRFFHTWFARGSQWDAVGVSKYGPPPGYLVGGPNPGYNWDPCCPSGCGGRWGCGKSSLARCGSAVLSPPAGQPPQKSYLDFNDNWPLDSWAVSEPDDGYQAQWVRLVSKFVK
ncbi:MAG TPA: glycoside hydrolase family 9 protein [Polyangiaceae bacterium]|nr:glycoside hydrolase family 9 protein [Polyangiaceae bacterium]